LTDPPVRAGRPPVRALCGFDEPQCNVPTVNKPDPPGG